jgi:branched-chain amino acid transport system ATP-binding protein
MLFELKDVTVYYGKVRALNDISMEIEEGTIVCLIGANGAGKSTILKAASGLIRLTAGAVKFGDRRIDNLPADMRVVMGLVHVPEGRRIFADLTVLENLNMGAYTRRDRQSIQKDFERIFNLFPILADRKNQKGGNLSGGEQQMLAFGRGLMANPKMLLLDEPSLGLASIIVKEIANTIKEVKEGGTTILLVEQNADMALRLADFGYVLETGSITKKDEAKRLLRDQVVRESYLGGG